MADQRFLKVLNDVKVIDTIDFTASEPASPTVGDTYIASTAGSSSVTSQSMTANYIYTYNSSGTWDEVVPAIGLSVFHVAQANHITYSGGDWPIVANYDPGQNRIEYDSGTLVTIPHSSTLNMSGGGFTVIYSIMPTSVTGTQYICHKESGGVGWGIYLTDNDIYVRYDDNVNDDTAINATSAVVSSVGRTFGTVVKPYLGGGIIYTLRVYSGHFGDIRIQLYGVDVIAPVNAGTVDSSASLHIGSNSAGGQPYSGSFARYLILNYALTPMIVSSVMGNLGAGGIFTASVDNAEMLSEGDFTTTTKWAATGDFTLGSGVATLAWTGDGTSTLTQTNANLASAYYPSIAIYVLKYDVTTTQTTGTLTITVTPGGTNYSDYQSYGNTSVEMNATTGSYEILFMIMATASDDFVITAVSSGGASGDSTVIDNLSLRRAGAVVNLGPDSLVA